MAQNGMVGVAQRVVKGVGGRIHRQPVGFLLGQQRVREHEFGVRYGRRECTTAPTERRLHRREGREQVERSGREAVQREDSCAHRV